MSALKKLIICIMLTGFFAAAMPQSAKAQFLAFAPSEIATAIKRFMGDVQNSKVIVFATQSTEKIQGALGSFNAAMASLLSGQLLERARLVKLAKCKFDQKKKKLKCSSAFQTYKKVNAAVGKGKEILDKGNKLINESKELINKADALTKEAEEAMNKIAANLSVIQEASTIIGDVNHLQQKYNALKKEYDELYDSGSFENSIGLDKMEAQALIDSGEQMLKEAEARYKEADIAEKNGETSRAQTLREAAEEWSVEGQKNIEKGKAMLAKLDSNEQSDEKKEEELQRQMNQISNEICELFNKVFAENQQQKENRSNVESEGTGCQLEGIDVGATIQEKIDNLGKDYEKATKEAERLKEEAKILYRQAEEKVNEGKALLAEAKGLGGALRTCKAGEDPDKNNCYKSDDEEYCKPDPVKDAADYCDTKYPAPQKTDSSII